MTASTETRSFARVVAAALVAVSLAACDAGNPPAEPSGENASPTEPAPPQVPSFRFSLRDRNVIAAAPGGLSTRERRRARDAMETVRSLVTDLYVDAFLDPQSWSAGDYGEVFSLFAGGARDESRRRSDTLTAGEDAGARFDRIEPVEGHMRLEVLLDRGGKPMLIATGVQFRARGAGAERSMIRSEGSYLFRKVDGAWRIVSFDVIRDDRRIGGA